MLLPPSPHERPPENSMVEGARWPHIYWLRLPSHKKRNHDHTSYFHSSDPSISGAIEAIMFKMREEDYLGEEDIHESCFNQHKCKPDGCQEPMLHPSLDDFLSILNRQLRKPANKWPFSFET